MAFNAKKSFVISLLLFFLIVINLVVFAFFLGNNSGQNTIQERNFSQVINSAANNSNANNLTQQSFIIADVAKHSNPSDCWIIVDKKVYDVSSYASQHPGGERAITRFCGGDASSAFEDQHSGSANAKAALSSLFIGSLSE